VLDAKWGIGQGFDTYFDDFDLSKTRGRSIGNIQRPGNEVVDKALAWMEEVKGSRFFAWVHLYDPHTPYAPPEPFKSQYVDHPYRGEIAFTDAQIGRVIEFLERRGLLDRTVIAVLGDHGESLGDHGEDAHGFFVYESATRVPFVTAHPIRFTAGRRVADPVRTIDLAPTVLDLLGEPPMTGIAGQTLVPLMTGAARELGLDGYAEAMYPLHHYGWSDLRALRSGRFKLIDAPRPELFDLERDPQETTNIFDERRTVGEGMIARLRELEAGFEKVAAAQPSTDVDPEVRARLAALATSGRSSRARAIRAPIVPTQGQDRPLQPDGRGARRRAGAAGFRQGERSAAARARHRSNVIDAWFSLGNAHFRERRYQDAITYFKKALELKPDYDLAVINMAAAYRNLGDDEAALAGFEHYLTIDPNDAYVRYQIGEVYLDRGELERAEEQFAPR